MSGVRKSRKTRDHGNQRRQLPHLLLAFVAALFHSTPNRRRRNKRRSLQPQPVIPPRAPLASVRLRAESLRTCRIVKAVPFVELMSLRPRPSLGGLPNNRDAGFTALPQIPFSECLCNVVLQSSSARSNSVKSGQLIPDKTKRRGQAPRRLLLRQRRQQYVGQGKQHCRSAFPT